MTSSSKRVVTITSWLSVPAMLGLLILAWASTPGNEIAVWLAVVSVTVVAGYSALLLILMREYRRLLVNAEIMAVTDELTGVGNRRRMERDLDMLLADPDRIQPHVLAMFDLDGFKKYNDNFGHPAGDELLRRLSKKLVDALGGEGSIYRMGGDEFAVLAPGGAGAVTKIVSLASDALSENGDGFEISNSYGSTLIPEDSAERSEILRTADRRMYGFKYRQRYSINQQARDVLLQTIRETDAQLRSHVSEVAQIAGMVAQQMGLRNAQIAELMQAAELHDVGKIAIPDAILNKPGKLDDLEWDFMRKHTEIAERILAVVPALRDSSHIVRSIHERWDGSGYPDGLRGEEIPVEARIILACDAFHAMTVERPFREAVAIEIAMQEIRRCAGSQFDPAVVDALAAVVSDVVAIDDEGGAAAAS